jgi:hypothetical protein
MAEGNSRLCTQAGNIRCNEPSVFAGCRFDSGWRGWIFFAFRELLYVMDGELIRVVDFHFFRHSVLCDTRSRVVIFGR